MRMRRIVVTGLIVSSALTLSWVGGASGQRVREVAAATTRTPTQVEVTNFPAVQGVAGTVNVGNLPAVQAVSGTVAVGNLPLDANGNVRVTPGPPSPPPSTIIKVADALQIDPVPANVTLGPFNVAGWHRITLIVQGTMASGSSISPPSGDASCLSLQVRGTINGLDVGSTPTSVGLCTSPNTSDTSETQTAVNPGDLITPEVTVLVYGPTYTTTPATINAWLYLFN